jgi:signal transduction histidine kinase
VKEKVGSAWHPAFDALGDGVCLLDAEGRIERANPALARLTGLSLDALIGHPVGAILNSSLGFLELPALVPVSAGDGRRRAAEVFARGRRYTLTFEPAASTAAGGVLVVRNGDGRDRLDEAKRLVERRDEEAVELRSRARRMHELERMKSDFLNLASHELRSPLAVLRGYISMLEDGSLGRLTEGMEAAVPVMTAKLREMNLLINQMLETARLEDSRLVLAQELLDLRDVLAVAAEAMRPIAAEHHPIVVDGGDEEVLFTGDRIRLTTIVTNLVDNAIKYSPAGGKVVCGLARSGARAVISISDRGIGIGPEDMARLFTRFGRVVNADNSNIPGTGLGLYLSRELARMHGGDIEVESATGQGSTFRLVLPLATDAA